MIGYKPWLNEPNFVKWIDADTGYHCAIRRIPQMLHLCGYVRIPRSHPLYRKYGLRGKVGRLSVHGGVTLTGDLVRVSGGTMRGFWIGFDCAHYLDLAPGLIWSVNDKAIYRDLPYVKAEVTSLAKQLKRMQK